jgi:tRNA threonylcarbamoyladenosine biosynthesis protein TsaB
MTMLLAVDSATDTIGLAVTDGDRILAEQTWHAPRHATVELASEAGRLMRRIGLAESQLTGLAVTIGPGSYSGLRVGLAVVKGLAFGLGLRIVAVPTLDVLAWGQPPRPEPMLTLLAAGRGRWHGAWYKWQRRAWKLQGGLRLVADEELTAMLDRPSYVCGELNHEQRQRLSAVGHALLAPPELCLRRPGVLAQMGWQRARTRKASDPMGLVPRYGAEVEKG